MRKRRDRHVNTFGRRHVCSTPLIISMYRIYYSLNN